MGDLGRVVNQAQRRWPHRNPGDKKTRHNTEPGETRQRHHDDGRRQENNNVSEVGQVHPITFPSISHHYPITILK